MTKLKPDIIYSDFTTFAGIFSGDKLGIPVVINVAGPVTFLEEWGFEYFNIKNAYSCCCMTIFVKSIVD
jgi:hypothetical protein